MAFAMDALGDIYGVGVLEPRPGPFNFGGGILLAGGTTDLGGA